MENPLFWSSIWFHLVRPVWKVQVATAVWNSVKLAILLPCSFKHVGMKQFERGAGVADVHDRVELELGRHVDDTFQAVNFHLIHKDRQISFFGHQNAHLASNTKVGRVPLNLLSNSIYICAPPISNEARVFQLPSHVRELFQSAWRTVGHADGHKNVLYVVAFTSTL